MPKSILLVEDASNDIEIALYALKECGVHNEIIVVGDGEEALDYLLCRGKHQDRQATNPGLVLLDLKLPKVDGIEVLRTIRHTPALSDIPVIVLTGSSLEADVERTVALGIDEYIIKPMEIKHFLALMSSIASRFVQH